MILQRCKSFHAAAALSMLRLLHEQGTFLTSLGTITPEGLHGYDLVVHQATLELLVDSILREFA